MSEFIATQGIQNPLAVELPAMTPKATSADGLLEASVDIWASDDGVFETGIWACTVGSFTAAREGYDELANIVAGRATLVGDDGVSIELSVGSTLITPNGWSGKWIVHEPVRKVYYIRNIKENS